MKSSHVVGVGWLGTGAEERWEGREQLHAAGLVWSRAAPVCMLLKDRSLGDQLEHTFINTQHQTSPNLDTSPANNEAEDTCVELPEAGLELKSPQKTRGAPGATSVIT